MGIVIPMAVVTGFWALVGILGPLVVRRGPNQGKVVEIQKNHAVSYASRYYIIYFVRVGILTQWREKREW